MTAAGKLRVLGRDESDAVGVTDAVTDRDARPAEVGLHSEVSIGAAAVELPDVVHALLSDTKPASKS